MVFKNETILHVKPNNLYGVESAVIKDYDETLNSYSICIKKMGEINATYYPRLHYDFVHELFYIKNKQTDLYLPPWF